MTKRLSNAVINYFERKIIQLEDSVVNYSNHLKNDEQKWSSYWKKMINTTNRKLKDAKANLKEFKKICNEQ